MKRLFHNKTGFAVIYGAILVAFTLYAALDTFVIPKRMTVVAAEGASTSSTGAGTGAEDPSTGSEIGADASGASTGSATDVQEEVDDVQDVTGDMSHAIQQPLETAKEDTYVSTDEDTKEKTESETDEEAADALTPSTGSGTGSASGAPVITANSYRDENIAVTITEYDAYDTAIYVADVQLASSAYFKTAFAQNTYGRNVTATTSSIAAANNAILAINGDFYGARNAGYVLRNGTLYRDAAVRGNEDLAIMEDGSFSVINESEVSASSLLDAGAWQVFSFGPALLLNGEIQVSQNEEVGKAMASNPRTAIGYIDDLHYVLVVSDGRTNASEGLSLYEMAAFLKQLGVQCAYNMDGGGSSTMVFQGEVVNHPTTSGRNEKERSVSDIVYVGY